MAVAKHVVVAVSLLAGTLGLIQAGAAQGAQKLFIQADMVRGGGRGVVGPACVLASQFKRNDIVVWRIRVLDPSAGKALNAKGLKSLVVKLPDGKAFHAHYGPHPRGRKDDFYWTTHWKVPQSYPTGTIGYKVLATDKRGRTTTWQPFKSRPSELAIVP